MIDEELLSAIENHEENPALARLIEIGRQKSYVTIDDIFTSFRSGVGCRPIRGPLPLMSAGVPYLKMHPEADRAKRTIRRRGSRGRSRKSMVGR
jgi:RNA polymerase primary sigma factor